MLLGNFCSFRSLLAISYHEFAQQGKTIKVVWCKLLVFSWWGKNIWGTFICKISLLGRLWLPHSSVNLETANPWEADSLSTWSRRSQWADNNLWVEPSLLWDEKGWVLLGFIIVAVFSPLWFSTEKPQSQSRLPVPAFPAAQCAGDASHGLCPLLCTYLWAGKVTPRCHTRGTAQPARLAREEPQMSLRWSPEGLIFVCSFSSSYQLKTFQKCSCYSRMGFSLSETHSLLLQLGFFSAALGEVVQLLVLSIIHELLYSDLCLLLPGGDCSSAAFSHFCVTVPLK